MRLFKHVYLGSIYQHKMLGLINETRAMNLGNIIIDDFSVWIKGMYIKEEIRGDMSICL